MNGLLAALISGVAWVLDALLGLTIFAIFVAAIISWLVAFDIINLRNRFAYNVAHFFDAVTRPILRPFRRIIPTLGGVDISPLVAVLIIMAIQRFVLPAAANALLGLVAPSAVVL